MNYRVFFILFPGILSFSNAIFAQAPGPSLPEKSGLKRFNPGLTLGLQSEFEIKSVRIGDNVLAKAIQLQRSGGQVHYISGGSRSRSVKISFYQPYQSSRLDQQFKLDFDKDKGFINTITVNYKLDSAYLDMQPVYQKVLENAVTKYGEPLLMKQVRDIAKQPLKDVLLARFSSNIEINPAVQGQVEDFFEQKIIASNTRFVEDPQGRAQMQSGFNECYLWPQPGYQEILSLCAFRKSKVNMKGQSAQMSLVNFSVNSAIEQFQHTDQPSVDIQL